MNTTNTNKIMGGLCIVLLALTVGLASHLANARVPQRQSSALVEARTDTSELNARLEAMMDSLHTKIDRLGKRQARLSQKVASLGDDQSGTDVLLSEQEQVPSVTPEEANARAEQRLAEQKYILAAVLEAEDQDPHWSAAAQQGLYESFALEAAPGMRVVDVTCRSSLCGAEFAFDGEIPDQTAYRNMLDSAPWSGERYVEMSMDADDPYIFMYIAREGHPLPQ